MTKKLHTEPSKDRAPKKKKQSTSKKLDNYNDGRDMHLLHDNNSDDFESPRETTRLEEKNAKGTQTMISKRTIPKTKKLAKINNSRTTLTRQKLKKSLKIKFRKVRTKKNYDSSTSNESNDDTHTLEENTPQRPLSNTKNLERTHSASSQRSDDYSEDHNRDVYRFCPHM